MYLDALESLNCSRALMIAQTSDAESGNLMEITVFDGKTVAQIPTKNIHLYILEVRLHIFWCNNSFI